MTTLGDDEEIALVQTYGAITLSYKLAVDYADAAEPNAAILDILAAQLAALEILAKVMETVFPGKSPDEWPDTIGDED